MSNRILWGILLGFGLLALAACAPVSATPTAGIPTAAATPVAPPTQPPTTGGVSPSPAPSPTLSAGQPVTLTLIHMLTGTDGWATGWSMNDRTESVLRTSDGGLHWRDVSPPGVSLLALAPAYFLDQSDAWVEATSSGTSANGAMSTTITTYRTTDGGQTWQAGVPFTIPAEGAGRLDFADSQHGWLMAGLGAAAGSEAIEILQTVDGGMHWGQASLTSGYPDQSTPGSLPFSCDKTGVTFLNASTGWATGDCAGGKIFFYVTHDGGHTWQGQVLPSPPGYPADIFSHCMCVVNPPAFVSPQNGVFPVAIYEASQGAFLYVTHDGGSTWSPSKLPVMNPLSSLDLANADDGWVTDGKQLYATHDGGQTWTAVAPFPTIDMRGSLDFVSASDGWFLDQTRLYATHDGGQNWATITPALVSPSQAPAPSPVPTSSPTLSTTRTVTLADNGQTITLHVGERFLLDLGEGYDWTITVDHPLILSRVVNVLTIRGSQGLYEAHSPGTATLTASGDPPCRKAQPPCMLPSRVFQIQVVVQ